MILASVMVKSISLVELLSSCLDASHKGCKVIRDFQLSHKNVQGTLKEGGEIRSVVTQADMDAQATILDSLRKQWGTELAIVGEEDETSGTSLAASSPLRTDLLPPTLLDEDIPLDELCLFVDPLDGTREFVEGRLENVACLIGITRNSRPIAGIIGLPFPEGNEKIGSYYAMADQKGSAGYWSPDVDQGQPLDEKQVTSDDDSSTPVTILTGDSTDPVLQNATAQAKSLLTTAGVPMKQGLIGGTAAKLLAVATRTEQMAILHFKTELWDTCALQSLLQSRGGKLTDLFGSPLIHSPQRPFGNIFGVVASSGDPEVTKLHEQLCEAMRADTQSVHQIFGKWMGTDHADAPSEPQAMDVARDLEGLPIDVKDLQTLLLQKDQHSTLRSYSVPETGAWRGMMSTGGRLLLDWEGDDNNQKGLPSLPQSIFFKRVVMAHLAHARSKLTDAPHKLVRDVKSYQVETSFLTSRACQEGLIGEAGIRINKLLGSDLRPVDPSLGPQEQLESRFSVLLEDFDVADGWNQQWLLEKEALMATLGTFARMHAYFWKGSNFWKKEGGTLGRELEEAVWSNGGYMQPGLQGMDQFEKVESGWKARLPSFKSALEDIEQLKGTDLDALGARLEKVVAEVGERAHPFHESVSKKRPELEQYKTFIHGDPKQANIFFKRSAGGTLDVGLIDFQWSGFGLAATEIAHHISAAVQPSCVSLNGEEEAAILDDYHKKLSRALVEFGVAESIEDVENRVYPRSVLQEQYEIALLDICRMVFAYAWRRWKAETEPTPESLNRNAYNKSFNSCLWLITRCNSVLSKWEGKL